MSRVFITVDKEHEESIQNYRLAIEFAGHNIVDSIRKADVNLMYVHPNNLKYISDKRNVGIIHSKYNIPKYSRNFDLMDILWGPFGSNTNKYKDFRIPYDLTKISSKINKLSILDSFAHKFKFYSIYDGGDITSIINPYKNAFKCYDPVTLIIYAKQPINPELFQFKLTDPEIFIIQQKLKKEQEFELHETCDFYLNCNDFPENEDAFWALAFGKYLIRCNSNIEDQLVNYLLITTENNREATVLLADTHHYENDYYKEIIDDSFSKRA